MPGPGFAVRVYDDIVVAIGRNNAVISVWIDPTHLAYIARINPARGERHERVVERRLAALLTPWAGMRRVLHRQAVPIGERLDHGVMPEFVGNFKERRDAGVDRAQADEGDEQSRQ